VEIRMTILFRSGFETGNFSEWAGTLVTNGLTPSVITFPFKGTYSARFLTNPTLAAANSQVYVNTSLSELYVRAYVYVAQGITALQRHDRFNFIRLTHNGWTVAVVGIRREADMAPRWSLWYLRKLDKTTSPVTYDGTHTYGTKIVGAGDEGRWICIEIHYNAATGLYEVWIDGQLEITMTVTPGYLPEVRALQAGISKPGASGQPYDPTGQYTIEVYGDEVIIADSYIGPDVEVPKLTVQSSPELGVPVYVDEQFVGNTPITVLLSKGTHTVRVEQEVTR
jgi:hypothetical protein